MKIGEVAKQLGINASAIRFYERHGLISTSKVNREENGYRNYSSQDIETISLICRFKDLGLELEEIKGLLREESNLCEDLMSSIETQLEKYNSISKVILQRIARLEQAKSRCQSSCVMENKAKNCCS